MTNIRKIRLTLLILLLLTSLACGISLKDNDDDVEALQLQLTRQSLQMTQSVDSGSQNQGGQPQPIQGNTAPQGDRSAAGGEEEEDDDILCNRAKFITETIGNDTIFAPGDQFTQTWTMRNDGTCPWDESYRVVFNEGDRMDGENSYYLAGEVEPGETVKLSVHLTAPAQPGVYKGYWNIKAPDDDLFTFFYVQIKVVDDKLAFAITSVIYTEGEDYLAIWDCSNNEVANCADITASAAGKVTYHWVPNIGDNVSGSVTFTNAGTKTVCNNIKFDVDFLDDIYLYIDEPNHQAFEPGTLFGISCTNVP